MKLFLSKLFRNRRRGANSTALGPVPENHYKPSPPTGPLTKSVDELRRELRDAHDQAGLGCFQFGQILEDDAVDDCRVFANRYRALEFLPKSGVVAEVGTQTGRYAKYIYNITRPKRLHLFDLNLDQFNSEPLAGPIQNGHIQFHVGDSSTELGKFPDEYFDWIYIDGDHSYNGVCKDIAQATRVVKRRGLLIFNDYTVWSPLEVCNYGILKAVNELVNGGEWKFEYLALDHWGYHDAALRRRS